VYYPQLLRLTNGLKWLTIVLTCVAAFFIAIAAANGVYHHPAHGPRSSDDLPLPMFFAMAGFIASFFASRYARTLSEENEGHLPVVWTKPVSRAEYAMTVIAADALGICAAFGIALVIELAFCAALGALPFIQITSDAGVQLIRFLLLPLAYYGLMMALTASFGKAGRGLIGWAWCFSFVIMLIAALHPPKPWDTIATLLNTINPLAYAGYSHTNAHETVNIGSGPAPTVFTSLALGIDIAALLVLCVAGMAAGIVLWRRVEA